MDYSQSSFAKTCLLICMHITIYTSCAAIFNIPQNVSIPMCLVFSCFLIWISTIDFETYRIPNSVSLILFVTGVVQLFILKPDMIFLTIIGSVFWPLLFWILAWGYERLRGRIGLGFGDVKLISGLALWVGFEGITFVILFAALAGIVTILVLSILRGSTKQALGTMPVAFGPFLCFFAWIVWLQGSN